MVHPTKTNNNLFSASWGIGQLGTALYSWATKEKQSAKRVRVVPPEEFAPVQQVGKPVFGSMDRPSQASPILGGQRVGPAQADDKPASAFQAVDAEPEIEKISFRRYFAPLLALPIAAMAAAEKGRSATDFASRSTRGGTGGLNSLAGEGSYSGIYSKSRGAFGYAWSNLLRTAELGIGIAGVVGVAYLIHKYWKSTGGNTNTNTNTNTATSTVNLNIKPEHGMSFVEEVKGGKKTITIESSKQDHIHKEIIKELLQALKEQKCPPCPAAPAA